jgi:hypothetical protein
LHIYTIEDLKRRFLVIYCYVSELFLLNKCLNVLKINIILKYRMSSPQFKLRYLLNFQRQRKNITDVGNYGKLDFQDIKRLDMYIKGNIFSSKECCLYTGEIKKKYSTISYKGKKVSVLRLLYHNYIKDVQADDTLEYLCDKTGVCCNLRHFKIKGKNPEIKFDIYEDYDHDPFGDDNSFEKSKKLNIENPVLNKSDPESDFDNEDIEDEIFKFDSL